MYKVLPAMPILKLLNGPEFAFVKGGTWTTPGLPTRPRMVVGMGRAFNAFVVVTGWGGNLHLSERWFSFRELGTLFGW